MSQPQPPQIPPTSDPALASAPKKSKTGCIIAAVVVGVFGVVIFLPVLAGLMFPAATGALRRAEEANSQNTAYNLKNAISAYFTEYRKYPGGQKGEDTTSDTEGIFMETLLGTAKEDEHNPRRISFYSGKKAKPNGKGGWRKGLHLDPGNTALYDPWGNPYRVEMDSNYDNQIENPAGDGALSESILVYSAGRDGLFDTWEDNVTTW